MTTWWKEPPPHSLRMSGNRRRCGVQRRTVNTPIPCGRRCRLRSCRRRFSGHGSRRDACRPTGGRAPDRTPHAKDEPPILVNSPYRHSRKRQTGWGGGTSSITNNMRDPILARLSYCQKLCLAADAFFARLAIGTRCALKSNGMKGVRHARSPPEPPQGPHSLRPRNQTPYR